MAQGPPALDSGVALTFDDVLLVPAASEILPSQADVSTQHHRAISACRSRSSPPPWTP